MMSTVSEKLLQVAQNNPKVYHSGQLNIVKNAECLKGSKSGSAMLLDDISPVTHNMGVKVSSKNLFDYDGVSFKNEDPILQPITFVKENNSLQFTNTHTQYAKYAYTENISEFGLMPNTTYTSKVIVTLLDNGSSKIDQAGSMSLSLLLQTNNNFDSSGKGKVYIVDGQAPKYYNPGTYELITTFTTPSDMTDFKYIVTRLANNTTTIFKDLQIEEGTTATDYTPYVPDLTMVKVKRCGKNLLNQSTTELGTLKQGYAPTNIRDFEDNTWYAALALSGYYDPNNRMPEYALNGETIKIKTGTGSSAEYYGLSKSLQCNPSTTYTLSYTMENGKTENASGIGFYGADKKHISFVYCDSGSSFTTPSNCYWIIVCFHGNTEDTYVTYSNIQLELGTTTTDYEPYITPTEYMPTTDGTINGVTSLYPNTTLITDTDRAIIDCEYYKDIDKTFNELTTSVALSGGDS